MYNSLVDAVVAERDFLTDFSHEEETEAAKIAALPLDSSACVDCREQEFITIDGADAHDFDDAVSCRRQDDNILLTVAIADVSSYVLPNTPLDRAAQARGNSIYLPDRVIPMLPTVLSNGICSLRPLEERLCLCCEMEIDAEGVSQRYRFFRALICSKARMNYDGAAAIMHGDVASEFTTPAVLWELAQILRRQRQRRGGMLLERPEAYCTISADGELHTGFRARDIAHYAIEEAMIMANRCAADFLIQRRRPTLHRTHARPSALKVQLLAETLSPLGISIPNHPAAADFATVLEAAEARDAALSNALTPMVLGTLARAEYSPNETTGHFGLACKRYTHFTSPIRRYPDLLTHRAIIAAMSGAPSPLGQEDLVQLGAHCGATEVKADKAGWDSRQRLLCVGAQKMINCEYEGYVSGVTPAGFFVTVGDLGIDGMVRFSSLAGYWGCNVQKRIITAPDKKTIIRVSDKINVRLVSVVPEKGRVDFIASDYAK
ncbi:MAG: RNB domain-containing ribonuclease [Proteobacteria bacterium]|nr:RNB domain-containing ribonuclease [Pseudomonadota bacterium]